MAYLRKRGKNYTAYVRPKNSAGKRVTIASFKFGKIDKYTAEQQTKAITKAEPRIISGELNKDNYKNYFKWLNDEGNELEVRSKNLGESINEFLIEKELSLRPSSYKRVKHSMNLFLEVFKPDTELKTFKTNHITEYKRYYFERHSEGGMRINLRNIKTFFKWCYSVEYMDRIPEIKISVDKSTPKYIKENDIELILSKCDYFYSRLFKLIFETGKRRSDLIHATIEGDLAIIPVTEGTKNKKVHSIRLDEYQMETLHMLHLKRDEYLSKGYQLENFKGYITKYFTKICRELGIKATLHGLRHSRAVMTHLETNDLKAVKDKLGHRDIKMSDRYADIDENLKQLHFPSSNQLSIEIEKLKKSLYDGTIKTKN